MSQQVISIVCSGDVLSHVQHQAIIHHYSDVIMGTMGSQITSLTIVYSTVYSDTDQGNHQSSTSLAFVWGIHRRPVNSPHKWPVTQKMFPFDDVIMKALVHIIACHPFGAKPLSETMLADWRLSDQN